MTDLVIAVDARKAQQSVDRFTQAVDKLSRSADRMDRSTRKAGREAVQFGNAAERASGRTNQFATRVKQLATGFAALAVARRAVTTIASFEQTMAKVRGVTRGTADEIARMTETAREMGATTRFSATQAGEGLLFLSKAGFDANEAIAALGPSLNLALAAGIELGQSADILSNIMGQFGIEASESARVVDVLVSASNNSNVSLVQLAESFKLVGPLANAAGLSLEEAAAAVGVLGNAGIQGSLAGTALRGSLITLLSPTDEIKQKMEAAGISTKALSGDLATALRGVKAGTLGFADAIGIFQRRFASAGLVLSDGVGDFEDLKSKIDAGKKSGEAFAGAIDNTLVGAFKSLNAALDEAFIKSGDQGLLGILRDTVDLAADTVRALAGIESSTGNISTAARGLALAIEVVIYRFLALKGLQLLRYFKGLVTSLNAAALASGKLSAALKFTPIGAAALGIGALTAGLMEMAAAQERVIRNTRDVAGISRELVKLRDASQNLGRADLTKNLESQVDALSRMADKLDMLRGRSVKPDKLGIQDDLLAGMIRTRTEEHVVPGLKEHQAPTFLKTTVVDVEATSRAVRDYAIQLVGIIDLLERAQAAQKAAFAEASPGFIGPQQRSAFSGPFDPLDAGALPREFQPSDKLKDAIAEQERFNSLLRTELTLGRDARLAAEDRMLAEKLAADNGAAGVETVIETLRKQLQTERELTAEIENRSRAAEQAAASQRQATEELIAKQNQYAQTVVFGAIQGIRANQSFEETLRGIANALADLIIQEMILKAIRQGALGASGNVAKAGASAAAAASQDRGGVMFGGQIQQFAKGGLPDIITSPIARVAAGTLQTFGENVRPEGKEAVLPLKRNASGELGVVTAGARGAQGGGTTHVTQNITFVDKARDTNDFRRNEKAVMRKLRDGVRNA